MLYIYATIVLMNNPNLNKGLRYSIIFFICLTLLTPVVVFLSMYFPYITGKAFYMRSVILIATGLYIVLATVDPSVRPRRSPLMFAVLGFLVVLGLATWNGVSPSRSFWSNFERMEGLVTLLYMGALFIVASSVVRKREWTWLMNTSLAISLWVGLAAVGDIAKTAGVEGAVARISGTMGNSSYLGVYALIHIFFAGFGLLMIYRGKREEELLKAGEHTHSHKLTAASWSYIALYALLGLFNAFILFKTGTRGSFIGLVVGLFVTSMYIAWREKNKVVRYAAGGFLVAVCTCVLLLGIFKHSTFVTSSPTLNRFGALITTDYQSVLANQGQARTVLWKMAYKGVQEKPLLGWGQDSFGYIFAKYYDPAMYAQEQWFDRSHNVFLDWLVSAGILGLIGYLALFVFALVCIFSKRARLTVIEKSVLLGLLAAYFIHNLFVFDNLSSYVLFFLLLAYTHERYTHDSVHAHVDAHKKQSKHVDTGTLIIASGFIVVLVGSYVGYKSIVQPLQQNLKLIDAMTMASQQSQVTKELYAKMKTTPADVALADMKEVFTLGRTGEAEAFEQLNNVALALFPSETVSDTTKLGFFNLYQERVAYHDAHSQGDPRYPYFMSSFYGKIGSYDKALEYAKKTYALSPTKQSFAYGLAILELQKANITGALVYLKKAYEDAPQNSDAFGYYISTLIEAARTSPTTFDTAKLGVLAQVLADGYKNQGHTILVNEKLWDVFAKTGKKTYARQLAARLIILVPEKKTEIEAFVK